MSWLSDLSATGRPKFTGKFTYGGLRHVTEREHDAFQLRSGGRVKKVALVAIGIAGAAEHRTCGRLFQADVVTGGQFLGAQFHRHVEEILELDLLVAGHARDRRLAGHVAVGEARHHLFGEAALVIEDVVGNADEVGYAACILDVLTGAAGAFAGNGFPVVVKLERDADNVIALAL